jgi:hypothetical protein
VGPDGRGKAQWLGVQEGKSTIFVVGGADGIAFIFRPGGLNRTIRPVPIAENMATHHLPAGIYGIFGGGKNIKFYFPAITEQNIAHVNLFRKPINSSILMIIDAINVIFSDQVNPLTLLKGSLRRPR